MYKLNEETLEKLKSQPEVIHIYDFFDKYSQVARIKGQLLTARLTLLSKHGFKYNPIINDAQLLESLKNILDKEKKVQSIISKNADYALKLAADSKHKFSNIKNSIIQSIERASKDKRVSLSIQYNLLDKTLIDMVEIIAEVEKPIKISQKSITLIEEFLVSKSKDTYVAYIKNEQALFKEMILIKNKLQKLQDNVASIGEMPSNGFVPNVFHETALYSSGFFIGGLFSFLLSMPPEGVPLTSAPNQFGLVVGLASMSIGTIIGFVSILVDAFGSFDSGSLTDKLLNLKTYLIVDEDYTPKPGLFRKILGY